jgi:hypothetical protein
MAGKSGKTGRPVKVRVCYQGEEMTLQELSRRTGRSVIVLWGRIFRHGWTVERAASQPVRPHHVRGVLRNSR